MKKIARAKLLASRVIKFNVGFNKLHFLMYKSTYFWYQRIGIL